MRLLRSLFLLLALPNLLMAQGGSTTDILRGRVTSAQGGPLQGARVEAVSAETGMRRTANTGADGRYTIAFPDGGGRYQVTVTFLGHAPANTVVAREADEEVLITNFQLRTAAVALEGIQVEARRAPPPGQGDAGAQQRTLSGDAVNRLPLENTDPASLAALSPGVVAVAGADSLGGQGSFSVAGQRASQNNITLDGASFASVLGGGGSPLGVPQEGVRGTQVITNTYDVARGQFSGGQVATTTRGGTNTFRGSFSYQLRDDALQGNTGRTPWSEGYTQSRLSGGVGGPLIRNKLFYNLSFTAQRRTDEMYALIPRDPSGLEALSASPDSISRFFDILQSRYGFSLQGQAGAYDRTGDALSLLGRVDYVLTQGHTLALRGHGNVYDQANARIGQLEAIQNGGESESQGGGLLATLTSRFGGGWINELRASYTRDVRDTEPYVLLPEARVQVASTLEDGQTGVATVAFGGDRLLPQNSLESTLELTDELSWLLGDTHRIKLGGLVNRVDVEQQSSSNQLGSFIFNSLEDLEAGRPASFTRSLSPRTTQGSGWNAALYLGDTWRPSQPLQFTYGVRLEGTGWGETPAYNPAVESLFGVRTDRVAREVHVSPRAGFSWRLSEQGAPVRVLRGGFGEFRGRAPYSLYAGALNGTGVGGDELLSCVGAGTPLVDWAAYAADPASIPTACDAGLPGQPRESRPSITTLAPNFAAPRSWRASLGFQGQVIPRVTASLDASYARGVAQFGVTDLNLRREPAFRLAAEDGRPVYVDPNTIVARTGAVPLYASRVHPEFANVFEVRSDLQSETMLGTVSVNGLLPRRIVLSGSYTLQRSRDQSSFSFGGAQQGFSSTPVTGDPNDLPWTTSDLDRRHTFNLVLGMPIGQALEFALIGRGSSGSPFTPLVGGDINGDGARNDPAFIFDPASGVDATVGAAMQRVLSAAPGGVRECLEAQLGRVAERNSCRGKWDHSLNLRATVRPEIRSIGRRFSLGIDMFNLAAGADLLLHGSSNLSGWGTGGRGQERTLLYVRGFDPGTQQFRYEVNERFGQTREQRSALGSPFSVQITGRIAVGAQQTGFGGGLGGLAFGGGDGGGGGGRGGGGGFPRDGGGPGERRDFDPSQIIERLLPNPVSAIVALRDTLGLSAEQVSRLEQIGDSLGVRNEPIRTEVAAAFERQGGTGNPGEVFQRIGPRVNQGRRNIQAALDEAEKVLTREQWRRVPAAIRNAVRQGGPPR